MMTLALLAGLLGGAQDTDSKRDEIVSKLNNQKITLDFKDVSLEDALGFVRDFAGINIHIDSEVHTVLSEDQLVVNIKVRDLILKSALKLMLNSKDLTATYKDGVLLVIPKSKANKAVTTRVYDIRDLLLKIQDFPGPKVELTSGGGGGTPLTGATFAIDEEPKNVLSEDFIVEIVKSNTGDGAWDENENASITLANGLLIVTQSKKVHSEVERLLNLLRQFK
jgi:HSP20 family molecular chaperone IbpA